MNELETKEWHKIGDKLTAYLGICSCQRKLKSIVEILLQIQAKIATNNWNSLTTTELFVTALLEQRYLIAHGTNSEYPFLNKPEFWEWLNEIKDSPYLKDN